MATHFSILAWRVPWTEQPGRLQSVVSKRVDTTEATEHGMAAISRAVAWPLYSKVTSASQILGTERNALHS